MERAPDRVSGMPGDLDLVPLRMPRDESAILGSLSRSGIAHGHYLYPPLLEISLL